MEHKIQNRKNGSKRVLSFTEGESRARDSFKEECDINTIMKRYQQTGQVSHLASSMPFFGDATEISDYRTALDAVIQAQEAFDSLPSHIRAHFQNDPALLLDFVNDPNNVEKGIELGLFEIQSLPIGREIQNANPPTGPINNAPEAPSKQS